MIPMVGFLPPDDARVRGTIAATTAPDRDGFVRATRRAGRDGLPPGEGSFLLCAFWLMDNLA